MSRQIIYTDEVANVAIGNDTTDISFQNITWQDYTINVIDELTSSTINMLERIAEDRHMTPIGNRLRFASGFSSGIFTGIDIATSWREEGVIQASITALTSTGISIALGAIFIPVEAPIATALCTSIVLGIITSYIGKGLDWTYDRIEESIQILTDEEGRNFLFNLDMPNFDDVKHFLKLLTGTLREEEVYYNTLNVSHKVNNTTIDYTIQPGDTVWDLCQEYDLTYEEIINLNPWLADRFSDDMEFALIKPGERLILPNLELDFDSKFSDSFWQATQVTTSVDPILIDLNNDGIKTTTVENGKQFDHENDGFAEKSAWVDENDGILVIDKNNNGIIDNGSEIFGDSYIKSDNTLATNGFNALADLDSNNDGIINASDTEFNNIKILKGDGTLISLSEAEIVSINLNSTASNTTDENGNKILSIGTFAKSDETTGDLADFNLQVDKVHSVETNKVTVSEAIAALPDVNGFGVVHSLHQAMALDTTGALTTLVESYLTTTDITNKRNILLQILYKWTGAENIADGSRGQNFDAKKLYVLEQFMGENFIGADNTSNPSQQAANF